MSENDVFQFADEEESFDATGQKIADTLRLSGQHWKVLVIDDEPEVHSVTRMVLADFVFAGRPVELLSAHSAAEAEAILREHDDIALALVDVVMESDHAGLQLIKCIREDIGNQNIRLVLRTGQPGQAPEEKVIVDYDINDYKDKTELTAIKLKTLMYSSLRSYRDIVALDNNRKGLEQVIEASTDIFRLTSLSRFFSAVLTQMTSLLDLRSDAAYVKQVTGFAATTQQDQFEVMAGTGAYAGLVGSHSLDGLPLHAREAIERASQTCSNLFDNHHLVACFESRLGTRNLLYVENFSELNATDRQLIEIFCTNAAIAFENACLKHEIDETQRETVCLLGEAVESRSLETGKHVKRVAEISAFLAHLKGLDDEYIETLRAAAPLHDLGKVGIADSILNKPGRHDAEEMERMREHVTIGYEMLRYSSRPILKCAATIAEQHHERWDGEGYPHQRKGEEIDIAGRIVAIADVFDALCSARCYKEPWPVEKVLNYFMEQRGKQFDPGLVDLLVEHVDAFNLIRAKLQD
ncbi:MAG: DUF3369 domain-containing protein [Hahellaceae bacterium]|nr:DUF3369 domain-containing protein [Hahellaceae bacterium]MCP5169182.1 DUF3369 domain-containing protein [Hahellaceae bacterium]